MHLGAPWKSTKYSSWRPLLGPVWILDIFCVCYGIYFKSELNTGAHTKSNKQGLNLTANRRCLQFLNAVSCTCGYVFFSGDSNGPSDLTRVILSMRCQGVISHVMSELAGKMFIQAVAFQLISAMIALVLLPYQRKKHPQMLLIFGRSVWYIPLPIIHDVLALSLACQMGSLISIA